MAGQLRAVSKRTGIDPSLSLFRFRAPLRGASCYLTTK